MSSLNALKKAISSKYTAKNGEIEREIAKIRVTDVRPTQSTCEVVSHKGKRTIKEGDICRPTAPVKQKRASTAFDDL